MDYLTTLQIAKKWNISQRRVAIFCAQNRIPGAIKAGKTWLIPSDCKKPEDGRYESSIDLVSEPVYFYSAKTELMLNPSLVESSKAIFAKSGKTLSEGVNEYLKQVVSNHPLDYSASYPHDFFKLFGSVPDLDFPDNIDDLSPEKVEL